MPKSRRPNVVKLIMSPCVKFCNPTMPVRYPPFPLVSSAFEVNHMVFYEISDFIKSRDGHMCQICGRELLGSKSGHIHHRDGDKENSSQDNLLLLCVSCHSKVHASTKAPLPIMALRAELHWNR